MTQCILLTNKQLLEPFFRIEELRNVNTRLSCSQYSLVAYRDRYRTGRLSSIAGNMYTSHYGPCVWLDKLRGWFAY
jgi:hypothetical protein